MLSGREIWSRRIIIGGESEKVDDGVTPSYGLDGCLYTFRCDVDWELMNLYPGQYLPMRTLESVMMPTNCGGLLTLKSTYGRRGVILTTNSPVDPGYYGVLSVNLFNCTPVTVVLNGAGGFLQMTVHDLGENAERYNGRWLGGR